MNILRFINHCFAFQCGQENTKCCQYNFSTFILSFNGLHVVSIILLCLIPYIGTLHVVRIIIFLFCIHEFLSYLNAYFIFVSEKENIICGCNKYFVFIFDQVGMSH